MPAGADLLELEISVHAAAPTVWKAIVDDERRRDWWSYLDLDARSGGRLVEHWRDADGKPQTTTGEVLEAEAPHLLRCTWQDDDWPAATEIELRITDEDHGARVRLRHAGWERLGEWRSLRSAHEQGWKMHLANLKRYAEGGDEAA